MGPNLIAEDFRLEQCLNLRDFRDLNMISIFSLFVREFFENYGQHEDPEIDKRSATIMRRNMRTLFGREPDAGAQGTAPGH